MPRRLGLVLRRFGSFAIIVAAIAAPQAALAHGAPVLPAPSPVDLILGWGFEPTVLLPAIVALLVWRHAVVSVNRRHPGNPVPRRRSLAFATGVAVLVIALDSGLARYDTTLFSVHMVQHMLLTIVAPPLLLLGAPITLALRYVSPETRRSVILPVLHSRLARALSFPVVSWALFAAVMWGSHFSPLFDLALEDELVHRLEHALYLGAGLLFWWPVVGADPVPWRIGWPGRLLYTFLQMPQNTFLALAIYSASEPLYRHYATLGLPWLPSPLADQQVAGGLMWIGGDLLFLTALLLLVGAWLRADERHARHTDRRLDAELAAIREREAALAARSGREGDYPAAQPRGTGASNNPR